MITTVPYFLLFKSKPGYWTWSDRQGYAYEIIEWHSRRIVGQTRSSGGSGKDHWDKSLVTGKAVIDDEKKKFHKSLKTHCSDQYCLTALYFSASPATILPHSPPLPLLSGDVDSGHSASLSGADLVLSASPPTLRRCQ